jgi:hypothetical protein
MTRWATPDERADHDRDLRKHEPRPGDDMARRSRLASTLISYVSGDDVDLDRRTFLSYVRDRITDDLSRLESLGK